MIAIIRITGLVKMDKRAEETLYRMRLRRKYVCVIANEKSETVGMMKKIRNYVAYGKINEETLAKLVKARGQTIDKSPISNADKIAKEILAERGMEELGLKPFFRLHPPRGGIKSKVHYPKGVLGDNKENINKLIERML